MSRPSKRSSVLGVVLAVLSVATATGLRAAVFPLLGGVRFLLFFPAVLAAAVFGGPLGGVTATVLSTVVLAVWFGPTPAGQAGAKWVLLALFDVVAIYTVWLCVRAERGRAEYDGALDARLRLAAIVESSDDAIVSKGLDGVIRSWNAAATRIFGYVPAEIVGHSIGELVPDDQRTAHADMMARLRRGERIGAFETLRLAKGGVPTRVLVTVSPLLGPDGTIVGAVEIARDVIQRVRAEADLRRAKAVADQNLAQLRAVIGSMSEGVVVADAHGNLLEWNQSALDAHQFASVDEVRWHLHEFTEMFSLFRDGVSLDVNDWPMARTLRGETFTGVELTVRRRDRPLELIVSFNGTPVYDTDGTLALAVLTLHDVTEERRAQKSLRETAERLGLALEAGGLGDWEWDAGTDLITLSPAAAALFGVTTAEPITRTRMRDLLHDSDRDRAARANALAAAGQGDYDIEYRVRRADGAALWVAAKGRGQFDASGTVVRMLGTVQDITPRKTAEEALHESRAWLELAVTIAQMGTFKIDLPATALTLNDAGRAVYGFAADTPLSFDAVTGRIHPDDHAKVIEAVRASVRPDGPRRFDVEHRIARTDGVVRWIRVRGRTLFEETPVDGPRPVQCVGTFLDVTDQKLAEQQREQVLAAEQAARAAAEHASRMKDEFLATLSHELRTPLNAILGWSQILRTAPGNADDVEQGLIVIERNARSQAQIIEDLLDMSRITSGKVRLDMRPIDLDGLVQTAVDSVRPTADAKGVRLDAVVDDVGPVTGDPGRVQQVLWNLLTNAMKFTPNGGRVAVRLQQIDGHAVVSVADTGEGIRPDFLPYVFDRFRQADATTTRRHGGLGLGLAIVKQLAELHGGTIRAESAGEGQGATFTLTLPTATSVVAAPVAIPAAPTEAVAGPHEHCVALHGVRVLVVDDEPDARAMVRRLLEDCDAVVTTAGSAAEAMAVLTTQRHDVLVSDIGMPGEDGYALIGRVRALSAEAGGTMPAVALTAYARSEDRTRAVRAGFQMHVAKPVEPAELLAVVASLAERA